MLNPNYKQSVSSGNTFLESPGRFIWSYGMGNWGEDTARSAMGTAAHLAVGKAMMEDWDNIAAIAIGLSFFDQMREGEVTKEREAIGPIVTKLLDHLRPLGKPESCEQKSIITGETYGLRYPIKLVTDLEWPDLIVELKTTLACPSKIGTFQFKHIRQAATYSKLRGKPARLVYASHANSFPYDLTPEEVQHGWEEMLGAWQRIEALDQLCPTPADAISLIPFCSEQWYGEEERKRARRAWDFQRGAQENED